MLRHEFRAPDDKLFCRLSKIKSRTIWRGYAFTITVAPRIANVNGIRRVHVSNWAALFFSRLIRGHRASSEYPSRGIIDPVYIVRFTLLFISFFAASENARILLSDVARIKNDICHGSDCSKISQLCEGKSSVPDLPGVRLEHISAGSRSLAKCSTKIRSLRLPFDSRTNILDRFLMRTWLDVCSRQVRLLHADFSNIYFVIYAKLANCVTDKRFVHLIYSLVYI